MADGVRQRSGGGGGSSTDGPALAPGPALSRDLGAARRAYESGDVELSRRAHASAAGAGNGTGGAGNDAAQAALRAAAYAEPGHTAAESSVRSCFAYGALEGLSSALVLTSAGLGLHLTTSQLLRLLVGGLGGLALSSAARAYTRYRLYNDAFAREKARETWELSNFPAGEVSEMVELYQARGMSEEDARTAVTALARYPHFFVDIMMVQELGQSIPDSQPHQNALAALGGFALAAAAPLVGLRFGLALLPELIAHSTGGSAAAAAALTPATVLGRYLSPAGLAGVRSGLFGGVASVVEALQLGGVDAAASSGLAALTSFALHPLSLVYVLATALMFEAVAVRRLLGSNGRKGPRWAAPAVVGALVIAAALAGIGAAAVRL